jgi:hypothetical protein
MVKNLDRKRSIIQPGHDRETNHHPIWSCTIEKDGKNHDRKRSIIQPGHALLKMVKILTEKGLSPNLVRHA